MLRDYPENWLGVYHDPQANGLRVACIISSPEDELLKDLKYAWKSWGNSPLTAVLDRPDLRVFHSGIRIKRPESLSARRNWLRRYDRLLSPHLRHPAATEAITYEAGKLSNPLLTYKASVEGPCPLPKTSTWPTCSECATRMDFIGVINFEHCGDIAYRGSVTVHVCNSCASCTVTFIRKSTSFSLAGDGPEEVSIGTHWPDVDYANEIFSAAEISDDADFTKEESVFMNFVCWGDKIGGHFRFIQNTDSPQDSKGDRMKCVGQVSLPDEYPVADCGFVYVYHSNRTGEWAARIQSF